MRAPLLSKFGGSFQGCRQQRGWRGSEQTQSLDARSPQRDVRAQGGRASPGTPALRPGLQARPPQRLRLHLASKSVPGSL